jgi:tripartite-type tricarboxylate transporter receptor subunit TctC
MALFTGMTNTRMVVVPYKGVGPALTGVIAGEVNLMVASMLSSLHHVRSRKLIALGVTGAKRVNAAPEIPTISEAGVPGYQADNWSGLIAPAGTPRPIVTKLHATVVQALQDPALAKRFADEGAEAAPSGTPAEFGTMIRTEVQKWSKVARDAGIEPL